MCVTRAWMTSSRTFAFVALALAAMGLYVAYAGDKPGAAVLGFLLMFVGVGFGVRTSRNRLSAWTRRAVLAAGAVVAALAAFFIHAATVEAALFTQPPDVPSVNGPAAPPQWAAAIDRARPMVRAAVVDQNLPGVSIAVGTNEGLVWAEGFGWRDVITRTPVTTETRFNIGTAAAIIPRTAIVTIGMTNTGTDAAADWSPGHVGEPEEDFPGFTAIHDLILRPLGLSAPRKPLAGERATFYVPTTFWQDASTDPREGRRLMYMRDLACCAEGKPFYSTPSDLVRFALAAKPDSINGQLAGGNVMSLVTRDNAAVVVVVTSNIAYANTPTLGQSVADAFARGK